MLIRDGLLDNLNELGAMIVEINGANGWDAITPDDWDDDSLMIPVKLALVHSEISEALEAFRAGDKNNFVEEMADTVIRILEITYGLEKDIGVAILDKLEKNRKRGFRHGGKRI